MLGIVVKHLCDHGRFVVLGDELKRRERIEGKESL